MDNNFKQRPDLINSAIAVIGENYRPYSKSGVFIVWDEVVGHAQTAIGVIMPYQPTEELQYRYATVISVSSGVKSVKFGDRVVIGKFYGKDIPYEYSRVCRIKYVSEDQIDALII